LKEEGKWAEFRDINIFQFPKNRQLMRMNNLIQRVSYPLVKAFSGVAVMRDVAQRRNWASK